jgi:hypothetical protein
MEEVQLSGIIDMENPKSVLHEARTIAFMMFPEFDFTAVEKIFKDIVRLFRGEYPGYKKCNTEYHDLKHTTDTFLAMARLMHGASIAGKNLENKSVSLGLVCALMHDTGYIQTLDDDVGTGAKYVNIDTSRSIIFMQKYLMDNGYSLEDFEDYSNIIICTGLEEKIKDVQFGSRQTKLLGKILGTADLLGQMADRTYLEKLLFLFYEFREAGIPGYKNELELLKKTKGFYDMARKRFSKELDSVNKYMRYHFKDRWNIDRDLYMEAIENHIKYLAFILENHEKDYRDHLKRDRIVKKLKRKRKHID